MWFTLVAIAILVQSPAPIRQKQQTPAEHKSDVAKQPPATPTVVNNPTTSEKQDNPKEQPKWWVPPPPWDIYWPTLGLVILAGIAACIAIRTLKDIQKQTRTAKIAARAANKSADAALKNAQAVIDAERAWIMVDLEEVPGFPLVETWQDGETIHHETRFRLRYVNEGKTIAWIDEIWACFRIREHLPPNPNFNELYLLALGREWLGSKGSGYRDNFLQAESIESSVIWGFVKYRDAFGEHKTVFGFRIQPDGKSQRLETQYHKYNENT